MASIAFPGPDYAALTAVGASGSDVFIVAHVGGTTPAEIRRSMTLTEVANYARGQLLDNDPTLSANSTTKAPTQQAIKTYVGNVAAGLSWKAAVRAATTVNGADATAFEDGDVIDGVTLATGDRILRKNQTTGSQNGIFTVNASGAPTRATDADADAELPGAAVVVLEGTANAGTQWTCTNTTVTLGTTALTFVQIASGGATYAAGSRLQLVGNTFSVPDNAITYAAMQNFSATKRLLMRKTVGAGDPEEGTISDALDMIQTPVQGAVPTRDGTGWGLRTPGIAGQFLTTNGPGANVSWTDVSPELVTATLNVAPPDLSAALVAYGLYDRGQARETTGTVPAVRDGDAVAFWRDAKAGTYPLTQATAARQLKLVRGVPVSSHGAYQYLVNASLPVNARANTIVLVIELNSLRQGFDGSALVQYRLLFRGGSDILNLYYDGVNKVLQVFGGSGQALTSLPLGTAISCTRMMVAVACGASDCVGWVNATSQTVTVLPAASGTGSEWFGWSALSGGLEAAVIGWAVYNRKLTSTEMTTNVYPWAQGLGAVAVGNCNQVLAADGDSITSSVAASGNRGWFRRLAKFADTAVYNYGEPFYRLANMNTNAADVDAAYQGGKPNVLIVWGGTNDITLDGVSAATAYSRLTTYCAARRATGWKVIVITALPRIDNDAGKETIRLTFNASIRSGWTGFADACFDVANTTLYPQFADPADPTNFPDGVHPNDAGNAIIAAGLQPMVNYLLG